jgi:hypothetical protein
MNVSTFATRRRTIDMSTAKGLGIDPFILPPLEEPPTVRIRSPRLSRRVQAPPRLDLTRQGSTASTSTNAASMRSYDSRAPLVARKTSTRKAPPVVTPGMEDAELAVAGPSQVPRTAINLSLKEERGERLSHTGSGMGYNVPATASVGSSMGKHMSFRAEVGHVRSLTPKE